MSNRRQFIRNVSAASAAMAISSSSFAKNLIMADEKVRIIATFNDFKGQYMYHCHNLEHEDMGMMGLMEII